MSEIHWIKLTTDMFSDEKIKLIESMPEGEAILIIWIRLLCIAGRANRDGYIFLTDTVPYSPEMLSTIFNKPIPIINLALKTLHEFGMIEVDNNGVMVISNWTRHQNIESMERIREQGRLRQQKYRETKLFLSNSNVTSRDGNAPEENRIDKNRYSCDSLEFQLAEKLFNLIKNRNPKYKEPDLERWANQIDLMIRKDGRNPEDIENVIDWCQQDEFWYKNILSTQKLRKQFDQLYIKMNADKNTSDNSPSPTMQKILQGESNEK